MGKKTRAYVDTSAFIAFLDRSDTYHPFFSRLFSDPPPLVTSSLVIAEGHGWFLRRYNSHRALEYLGFVEDLKVLVVEEVGPDELKEGAFYLRRFSDQSLSLADAMGLSIMDRQRLSLCWSTDQHLGLTGRTLIIHQS